MPGMLMDILYGREPPAEGAWAAILANFKG
jgi:hypothetical protein